MMTPEIVTFKINKEGSITGASIRYTNTDVVPVKRLSEVISAIGEKDLRKLDKAISLRLKELESGPKKKWYRFGL